MLILKEANFYDAQKEYEFITELPENENGFTNEFFGCSKSKFLKEILPLYIKQSKGENLPEGFVPITYLFLWNDSDIVGFFKLRHKLTDYLANVSGGHIGYCIKKDQRGKGFATKGLKLAIEKAKKIIKED